MRALTISNQITNRENPSLVKYLSDIKHIPMITAEEEVQLAIRIKNGDEEALQKLILSNLRFVVSVAKQYQSRGMNLHDLINEGNIGLVKAASKFDETRGFKFISYAVWWIRQGILQAVYEKARMVRLPLNKISVINKINDLNSSFEQSHQRFPTAEEISDIIDHSVTEINTCLEQDSWTISMDKSLRADEDGYNLHDLLQSDHFERPDEKLVHSSMQMDIQVLLGILSHREAYIIKHFYGIGEEHPLSIEQIAQDLNLTAERVRQIKLMALTRLKNSSKTAFLKEYLV